MLNNILSIYIILFMWNWSDGDADKYCFKQGNMQHKDKKAAEEVSPFVVTKQGTQRGGQTRRTVTKQKDVH